MPTGVYQLADRHMYASDSLYVHTIEGVSYPSAKQLTESLGVAVLPADRLWEQLSILRVKIPSGTLEEWIDKLMNNIAIVRVTKIRLRYPEASGT